MPPPLSDSVNRVVPQAGQKWRRRSCPLSPRSRYTVSAPPPSVSCGRISPMVVENAPPVAFWQARQWQAPVNKGAPSTCNVAAPHEQDPCNEDMM